MNLISKCTNYFKNKCKEVITFFCDLPTKRYLLALFSLLGMLSNKKYSKDYLVVFIIFFAVSVAFYSNFEMFATWNNSKPLYYEDLYIDYKKLPVIALSENQKKVYKKTYTRILIISNSLLTSAIIVYWMFKKKDATGYFEIIGVTGGLLKIASLFNTITGKVTLYFIKSYINIKIFSEYPEDENEQLIHCESTGSQYDLSDDTRVRQESIGSQCDLYNYNNDIEHQ